MQKINFIVQNILYKLEKIKGNLIQNPEQYIKIDIINNINQEIIERIRRKIIPNKLIKMKSFFDFLQKKEEEMLCIYEPNEAYNFIIQLSMLRGL